MRTCRLSHDIEGQTHHVLVDVADFAVAPRGRETRREIDHGAAVGRDAIAMKRRLGEPTLPAPEVPLAGEQPVTEDGAQGRLDEAVLQPELVPGDQDVLDQIRMADERHLQRAERNPDDVAVAIAHRPEESERIVQVRAQIADERQPRGSRRKGCLRHFRHATRASAPPLCQSGSRRA